MCHGRVIRNRKKFKIARQIERKRRKRNFDISQFECPHPGLELLSLPAFPRISNLIQQTISKEKLRVKSRPSLTSPLPTLSSAHPTSAARWQIKKFHYKLHPNSLPLARSRSPSLPHII
jgi:hypothetical protein